MVLLMVELISDNLMFDLMSYNDTTYEFEVKSSSFQIFSIFVHMNTKMFVSEI